MANSLGNFLGYNFFFKKKTIQVYFLKLIHD